MAKSCIQTNIRLAYPRHLPRPEDLLHFIESSEFSADWAKLGLDDEDDLVSLQLCLMAHPDGDEQIPGSGGLRRHRHRFHRATGVQAVTVFYAYFPEFGIVYLNCVDAGTKVTFSSNEVAAIALSLAAVESEIIRRQTIRARPLSVGFQDGGTKND